MTVAELGRRMSGREMAEWEAYARIEPFGIDLANILIAHLCTVILAPHRTRRSPPPRISDFMLPFGETEADRPAMGADQMKAHFKSMANRHKRKR